jgi:argininosuccinate synthase
VSRIHRTLPPKGTRIGLAYSGGLDTRTAVLWLTEKGLSVHAYTADLGQPDEADPRAIPPTAKDHGATDARLLDCREAIAKEGIIALKCGAFHLQTGGKKYFNTTPLGRAVTATAIARAMKEDGVSVLSDGSTHKGNDIQRFYRYAVLENPELQIYKPWLDETFVSELGGRTEMSRFLERHGKPYKMGVEKAYSTDSNVLGATHEAKDLERLDRGVLDVIEPIMGVASWKASTKVEAERVKIVFERGVPVRVGETTSESLFAIVRAANEVGGRHGLGMSDQIENRVIDAKSRGIYEAPGMMLLHIAYERLLSAVHNENTTDLYFTLGRRLGRLLYEGKWLDPEALMIKEAMTRFIAPAISGEVEIELRRGDDWSFANTRADVSAYDADKLSMERSKTAFTPEDRIGALEVQAIGVLDNRAVLAELARR